MQLEAGLHTRALAARARRRSFAVVMACLRMLAVVLVAQLSGIGHLVVDVGGDCIAAAETDDCPTDPADCPPGCPNCHGHFPTSVPRSFETVHLMAVMPAAAAAFASSTLPAPPAAHLSRLYRPPKLG